MDIEKQLNKVMVGIEAASWGGYTMTDGAKKAHNKIIRHFQNQRERLYDLRKAGRELLQLVEEHGSPVLKAHATELTEIIEKFGEE